MISSKDKGAIALPRRKVRFYITATIIFLLILSIIYVSTSYSHVRAEPDSNHVVINFILPVSPDSLSPQVTVVPELPETPVAHKIKWINRTTMVLELNQEGMPGGQLLKFNIDGVATVIPFVKKNASGEIRHKLPLSILPAGVNKIPSPGPLEITFNTPVDPESLNKSTILPVPGRLTPLNLICNDKIYTDYSRWRYIPDRPFENSATYRITLQPGLRSMGGSVLNERREIVFTTEDKPRVTNTSPGKGEKGVPLYRTVEFTLDQDVLTASIKVTALGNDTVVPGDTEIKQNKVIFRPECAFLPKNSYRAVLYAKSVLYENLYGYELFFTTVDMGEKYWVDVKLGGKHTVTVYRGSVKVREMPASGGRSQSPTPMGCFYTRDRGHSFWSHRYGEGATYWVRLVGQILVHSVPKDSRWRTKEEEHDKLGLPASHGCIRLDEKDAKWFFDNIPGGTLVIIHK